MKIHVIFGVLVCGFFSSELGIAQNASDLSQKARAEVDNFEKSQLSLLGQLAATRAIEALACGQVDTNDFRKSAIFGDQVTHELRAFREQLRIARTRAALQQDESALNLLTQRLNEIMEQTKADLQTKEISASDCLARLRYDWDTLTVTPQVSRELKEFLLSKTTSFGPVVDQNLYFIGPVQPHEHPQLSSGFQDVLKDALRSNKVLGSGEIHGLLGTGKVQNLISKTFLTMASNPVVLREATAFVRHTTLDELMRFNKMASEVTGPDFFKLVWLFYLNMLSRKSNYERKDDFFPDYFYTDRDAAERLIDEAIQVSNKRGYTNITSLFQIASPLGWIRETTGAIFSLYDERTVLDAHFTTKDHVVTPSGLAHFLEKHQTSLEKSHILLSAGQWHVAQAHLSGSFGKPSSDNDMHLLTRHLRAKRLSGAFSILICETGSLPDAYQDHAGNKVNETLRRFLASDAEFVSLIKSLMQLMFESAGIAGDPVDRYLSGMPKASKIQGSSRLLPRFYLALDEGKSLLPLILKNLLLNEAYAGYKRDPHVASVLSQFGPVLDYMKTGRGVYIANPRDDDNVDDAILILKW
jgi:hypothetical protein